MSNKTKKLFVRKKQDALKIIDVYLNKNNKNSLNAYERRRFKDFANRIKQTHGNSSEFKQEALKLEKFLGRNKSGFSSYTKRKKIGDLSFNKQSGVYLKRSTRTNKTTNKKDSDILDIMKNWDEFVNLASEYNATPDKYFSEFATDFYPDWVERFKSKLGLSNYSNQYLIYVMKLLFDSYAQIGDLFGKNTCVEAIEQLEKNNFKVENEIQNIIMQIIRRFK